MSENMNNLKPKKIYARAIDPVHIGAGGYRLGRVDNTIVRDPATDVPKIPGTSIAGVIRAFYTVYLMENDDECKNKSDEKEKEKCAEEKTKLIFGDETKKGILRFYDGQIIFFPVSSIQGTVWITTKDLVEYWFGEREDSNRMKLPDKVDNKAYAIKGINSDKCLNLGWLLLEVKSPDSENEIVLLSDIDTWVKRIVIVSDKLFSHIVNDNLEVRTSVKIDPETGTAEDGKLFTYEAIPRGTVLGFEIGIDKAMAKQRDINDNIVDSIISAVSLYVENLDIGGMGTRGFGRLKILPDGANGTNEGGDTSAQS